MPLATCCPGCCTRDWTPTRPRYGPASTAGAAGLQVGAPGLVGRAVCQDLRIRLDAPRAAGLLVDSWPPVVMLRQALLQHASPVAEDARPAPVAVFQRFGQAGKLRD